MHLYRPSSNNTYMPCPTKKTLCIFIKQKSLFFIRLLSAHVYKKYKMSSVYIKPKYVRYIGSFRVSLCMLYLFVSITLPPGKDGLQEICSKYQGVFLFGSGYIKSIEFLYFYCIILYLIYYFHIICYTINYYNVLYSIILYINTAPK